MPCRVIGFWLIAMALWVIYAVGWQVSPVPSDASMTTEFTFRGPSSGNGGEIAPLRMASPLALAFIDPDCEVCVAESERIVRILQGFDAVNAFVIPVQPFEDSEARSRFPEELLSHPLDDGGRAMSGVSFVPAFVYISHGEEQLRFEGMPGPLQEIVWRLRPW